MQTRASHLINEEVNRNPDIGEEEERARRRDRPAFPGMLIHNMFDHDFLSSSLPTSLRAGSTARRALPPPHGWRFPPDAALAPMPRTDGGAHVVGRRSLFERIECLNPRELKVN